MKLFCECGKEILKEKGDKFNLKDFELDKFPTCPKCGRMWYVYILAREHEEQENRN